MAPMPTNPPSSFGPVQPIDRTTHHRAWYVLRLVLSWCGVSPLVNWACGSFVDEGDGRANRHASLFDEPSAEFEGDRLMTCAHGLGGPCYALRLLRLGSSRLVISGGVTKSNRCGAYGNSPRLAPSGSQGQSPACEPTSASGWAI